MKEAFYDLVDESMEEVFGAKDYAMKAMFYKDIDQQLYEQYKQLAMAELIHADKLIELAKAHHKGDEQATIFNFAKKSVMKEAASVKDILR